MKLKLLAFLFLAALMGNTLADDKDKQVVTDSLQAVFNGIEITAIKPAKIDGLYEVTLGTEIVYASKDGKYVFRGDMIDVKEKRNLTEEQRTLARSKILQEVPANEMIEFPASKPEHVVYVFTDISCGYCRRLHQDVPELNRRGISVRYLAFPRAGMGSPAFADMESVWCAADRNQAMTDAKAGKAVPPRQCKNPVAREYELGRKMGVRGTPAIYLENGKALAGYLPPDQLMQAVTSY